MSVDDITDANENEPDLAPIGTDFESDLTRVGMTVSAALEQSDDEDHQQAIESIAEHIDEEDISGPDAVVAAWFIILNFS